MKMAYTENLHVKKNWSSGGNSSVLRCKIVFQCVHNAHEKVTEVNSLKCLQIQLFTAVNDVSCNLGKL